MNKRFVSLVLSGVIVLSNTSYIKNVYANESIKSEKLIKQQDTKTQQVVYLADGEGDENAGKGTQQSPYQNIRTALKNIKDGEVLKLVGKVNYNKYNVHTDGSALPLFIDKDIIIEGESGAIFSLRAPIQLGADVTFKNFKLEMTPEVYLGRNINGPKLGFGQEVPRTPTIFAAGHTLTLDNVDTTMGTNPDQYKSRPYISGGSYKNTGKLGNKSIINIVNPNSETKISGIYAGDFWNNRDLDVEINLDGKLIDTTIYTGGVEGTLTGNVTVNLYNKANVSKFDKTNHNGNLDVNLKSDFFSTSLDVTGVDNLTLEENSKITPYKIDTFDVGNLNLKNGAIIDFRDLNSSPIVRGNFNGEEKISDTRKGGFILLDNDQTLDIKGNLTGTTRLNTTDGYGYIAPFYDNHEYVKAASTSNGTLTIEGTEYTEYRLQESIKDGIKIWKTVIGKETISDLRWLDGSNSGVIINPSKDDRYVFSFEAIDDQNNVYLPEDIFDFKYEITKPDGTVIDYDTIDNDIYFVVDYGEGDNLDVIIYIDNPDELVGELNLKITHNETQKCISKTIYLVREQLTGTLDITNKAIEGRTISADTSKLPDDAKELSYKWYVDDKIVEGETSKDFILTSEHVGKKVKVEVEAKNYLGTIFSSEVLVKPANVLPVITGANDIEIKASEVDEFNDKKKLENVTATDYNGASLIVTITGKVEKPAAGTNKTYELTYEATDLEGNTNKVVRNVTVTNQLPKITANDVTIKEGQSINLLEDLSIGLDATDYEDGNIKNSVIVKSTGGLDESNLTEGVYTVIYEVKDKDNNTITKNITITVEANKVPVNDIELKELAGETRYDTAIKISQERFKDGEAKSVILVGKDAVVDGLAAAPLAISEDAPILFADIDSLNHETKEEILRVLGDDFNKKTVYIVGGEAKISKSVEKSIASELGVKSVERISGEDRYLTSIEIAKKLNNNSKVAFVVGGNGEADAMSISAKAAELKAPIVVVEKGRLSAEAKALLENKEIYIIGGVNCISEDVKLELDKLDLNNSSERSAGEDRKETNAIVIGKFYDLGQVSELFVAKDGYVGGNDKLVDALAAAPLAATKSSPILLTTDGLNKMQQDNMTVLKNVSKIVQIGYGISKDVISSIVELIKNK